MSVDLQIYSNIQIIIIDDASQKNAKYNIQKHINKDNRINFIRNKYNKGLAASRNIAIENARGKYITFLDDDDYWDKDFVKEFVIIAEKSNEYCCYCCGTVTLLKNKEIKSIPHLNGLLKKYIKEGYTPPVSSQFYTLKSLKQIGGYNKNIKSGIDHDIWLRLSYNNIKIKSVEKALCYPNKNPSVLRITTRHKRRLTEIRNSLVVWREDIINNYGREFYDHFEKSYFYYINRKAILQKLQKKEFSKAIEKLKKVDQKNQIFADIVKGFIKGLFIRSKMLFNGEAIVKTEPSFPKFIK